MLPAPEPIRVTPRPDQLPPNDVEMSLVDHLEELRQRVFRSLIAIVMGALACLAGTQIASLLKSSKILPENQNSAPASNTKDT